ncbi:MAG: hypothetical protein K2I83_05690, partial [Bacteroidales bacterium]|nr:hypothetical protein [Bacteroidales bacterium]
RFGPYISFENKNYKIAKGTDAEALTLEDCRRIIAEEKPSARSVRKAAAMVRKTAEKKTATKKPAAKKSAATKKK